MLPGFLLGYGEEEDLQAGDPECGQTTISQRKQIKLMKKLRETVICGHFSIDVGPDQDRNCFRFDPLIKFIFLLIESGFRKT